MQYRSIFLYIIQAHFYTLLLAGGDAASLIAVDLLVAMYVQIARYGCAMNFLSRPCLDAEKISNR
jgi:hypothetical protein